MNNIIIVLSGLQMLNLHSFPSQSVMLYGNTSTVHVIQYPDLTD